MADNEKYKPHGEEDEEEEEVDETVPTIEQSLLGTVADKI